MGIVSASDNHVKWSLPGCARRSFGDFALLAGKNSEAALVAGRRGCEKMGLAPSSDRENPGKPMGAKVPVPLFSQPLRETPPNSHEFGYAQLQRRGSRIAVCRIEDTACPISSGDWL
jgi:hypothetical protein